MVWIFNNGSSLPLFFSSQRRVRTVISSFDTEVHAVGTRAGVTCIAPPLFRHLQEELNMYEGVRAPKFTEVELLEKEIQGWGS